MWSSSTAQEPDAFLPWPPPIEGGPWEGPGVWSQAGAVETRDVEPAQDTGWGTLGHRELTPIPGTAQTVGPAGILQGSTGGHPDDSWTLNPQRVPGERRRSRGRHGEEAREGKEAREGPEAT